MSLCQHERLVPTGREMDGYLKTEENGRQEGKTRGVTQERIMRRGIIMQRRIKLWEGVEGMLYKRHNTIGQRDYKRVKLK